MSGAADPWAAAAEQYQQEQSHPQTQTQSDKPEQGIVPYLSQVAGGLWNGAKSTAELLGKGVLATTNPTPANQYDFAQTAIGPNVRQGMQAAQDVKQGNYGSAVEHGVAAAVPGYGPAGANIIDKAKSGDWTGAAADATSLGALSYLGAKAPGAVEEMGEALGDYRTPNPAKSFAKAVKLRTEADDYLNSAPTTLGDIKRAAGNTPLHDLASTKRATEAAQAEALGILDLHLDPYRRTGMQISLNPIGDAIVNSIPMTTRVEAAVDPAAAAQVQQTMRLAQAYYNRPFTIDQLRNLMIEWNGQLNDVFHGTADKQAASMASNGGTATLRDMVGAGRQIMRNTVGEDASNILRRWGNLDDVKAGIRKAQKQELESADNPTSGLERDLQRVGAPGKLKDGNVQGAKYAARGGKINSLLRDTFDNVEPSAPYPTPQPSGMPGVGAMPNAAPTSRQLPPATPRLNAQTAGGNVGTTGMPPAWQQNMWQGIGTPKALPAPKAIVTPPPADTSFVRGVPAKAEIGDMMGPKRTMPTADSVAVQAGRAILDTLRNNPPQ